MPSPSKLKRILHIKSFNSKVIQEYSLTFMKNEKVLKEEKERISKNTNLHVGSGNETFVSFGIFSHPPTIRVFFNYKENFPFLKEKQNKKFLIKFYS